MTQAKMGLRGVVVERDGRCLLSIDELDVHPGEVLAVVGPNGAGKSTLVQVLALLERPTRGEVLFEGQAVTAGSLAYRRRLAVVFQEPLLLDTTVESNVGSGLALRGVPRAERQRRVRHWLERFGIDGLARRSSRALSGGEAQRASLARALALAPEALLLDEPFGALDAPTRESLIEDLDRALRETGTATVFVTHDRGEALRLGDRVAVLIGGRVRQTGPPWEVFSQPADEEVAAFLGVETVVPGRIRSREGGLVVVDVAGRQVEAVANLETGDDVLVCLRPEEVVIHPSGDLAAAASARNRLPAVVTRVVNAGPVAKVELDAGFSLVALITRQSLEDLALGVGSEVVASFKATAVHLIPRHEAPGEPG